ncbi:alkaline phosphatase family protein [candidate division KSB1 bacterium]
MDREHQLADIRKALVLRGYLGSLTVDLPARLSGVGAVLKFALRFGLAGGIGLALAAACFNYLRPLGIGPQGWNVLGLALYTFPVHFALLAVLGAALAFLLRSQGGTRISGGSPFDAPLLLIVGPTLIIGLILLYPLIWWLAASSGTNVPIGLIEVLPLSLALVIWALTASMIVYDGARLVWSSRLSESSLAPLARRPSGGRIILPAVSLLVCFGLVLSPPVLKDRGGDGHRAEAAPLPRDNGSSRVFLIGLDGFSSGMVEELTGKRLMINLRRFMAESALFRLESSGPASSAEVWTSIATGRPSRAHGIISPLAAETAGLGRWSALPSFPDPRWPLPAVLSGTTGIAPVPVASIDRREKALWNIADEAGLTVDLINWWGSWPAEKINGRVVSDRAWLAAEKGVYLPLPGPVVYPDELGRTLAAAYREADPEEVVPIPGPGNGKTPLDLERISRIDRFHIRTAEGFLETPADLTLLHLSGMDIIQRWYRLPGGSLSRFELGPIEDYLTTVSACARRLDRQLGRLLSRLEGKGTVILVLYPGWSELHWETGSPVSGLCLVSAAGLPPARSLLPRPPASVAAVVLAALGLPLGQTMDLTAIQTPVSQEFLHRHPVKFTTGYGPRLSARRFSPDPGSDRAYLSILESFNYVSVSP